MTDTSGIVELYAQHLEAKASRLAVRSTVVWGIVGALLGGFPLFHISNAVVPAHLGVGTLLLGAFAGAYIGYTIGQRKAVEVRFQAQLALHQAQLEQSLIGRAAPAVPAPAFVPPIPQPLPVQAVPAPVEPAPLPLAPVSAPVAAPDELVPMPTPVPLPMPAPAAPVPAPPLVHPDPVVAEQPAAPPVAPAPVAPAPPLQPAPVLPAPISPVPLSPPPASPAASAIAQPPLSSTGS
jgi:hypothetical protein